MGHASKAVAGGAAPAATVLVMYLLAQVPFVAAMPPQPLAALELLVGSAIGFALVYFAPKNTGA